MPDDTKQPQQVAAGDIQGHVEHVLEIKVVVIQRPHRDGAAAFEAAMERLSDAATQAVFNAMSPAVRELFGVGLVGEDLAVSAHVAFRSNPIDRDDAEARIEHNHAVTSGTGGICQKRLVH